MKITDTISVNPSKSALGHVDTTTSVFRSSVLNNQETVRTINPVDIFFPSTNSGVVEYKKYALPLRTIFATILIISGISLLTTVSGIHSVAFAICSLVFGTFLALGLFTRPLMMGAAVYYCICGALSLRAGVTDISLFSLMFGSLVFCVIGSGKYSCDSILRKAIISHHIKAEEKRKADMLGYKAFHRVKF